MGFIALLMVVATAIAGAAAYFSVYGLAYTFSGVFWSVVVMGASLEAGKLVAASYLYRYWNRTGWILKSYLITGVIALMVLTSTGIFGYLSTGYQQDVLPLKQKQQQVQMLEDEKARALARKQQIDDIIAGNSSSVNVGADANAARVLRESNRGRDNVMRQFRDEQKQVTQRVNKLDEELLALKQELVKAEAHIGPIMFVAQAFNMGTDDATKWLIFLIIFAFDPMAVALTLAVNIALKLHKDDLKAEETKLVPVAVPPEPEVDPEPEAVPASVAIVTEEEVEAVIDPQLHLDLQPVAELTPEPTIEPTIEPVVEPEVTVVDKPIEEEQPAEPALEVVDQPKEETPAEDIPVKSPIGLSRQFAGLWGDPPMSKINELVSHLRYLKERQAKGFELTDSENWELRTIEDILRKNGYDKYM